MEKKAVLGKVKFVHLDITVFSCIFALIIRTFYHFTKKLNF